MELDRFLEGARFRETERFRDADRLLGLEADLDFALGADLDRDLDFLGFFLPLWVGFLALAAFFFPFRPLGV